MRLRKRGIEPDEFQEVELLVHNEGSSSLTVQFEPLGTERELPPGSLWRVRAWRTADFPVEVEHAPDRLRIFSISGDFVVTTEDGQEVPM